MKPRIRTVEYDPGWGWIARNPWTGKEIMEEGFRWRTRYVARTVVDEARLLDDPKRRKRKAGALSQHNHTEPT